MAFSIIGGKPSFTPTAPPTVRINRNGIRTNAAFTRLLTQYLKNGDWVVLQEDKSRKRILIKPSKEGEVGARRFARKGHSGIINCFPLQKLVREWGIKADVFVPEYDTRLKGFLVMLGKK